VSLVVSADDQARYTYGVAAGIEMNYKAIDEVMALAHAHPKIPGWHDKNLPDVQQGHPRPSTTSIL